MPLPDHDHSRGMRESLAEFEDILEELDRDLAVLEVAARSGDVPPDQVNAIFRGVHSLKGVAGMLGYTQISGLAHSLENLLDLIRLGRSPLDTTTLEVIGAALDGLGMLVRVCGCSGSPPDTAPFLEQIAACCARSVAQTAHPPRRPLLPERLSAILSEFEQHRLAENVARGRRLFLIRASYLLESFDRELEALTLLLSSQGEVISTLPAPGRDRPDSIEFEILIGTDAPPAALPPAVSCDEIAVTDADESLSNGESGSAAGADRAPTHSDRTGSSGMVRVDIGALDELIALVGELVAAQNSLRDEIDRVRGTAPGTVDGLVKRVELLGKKLKELQQGVTEIRLVPLRPLFDRLARMVRKLAADEGRDLEVALYGAATRLDKQIVDAVADTLMHLVRNAVDHGIEPPAERRAAGKPDRGTITIAASQKGNRVVIEVADDGRGIDLARVRRQAVTRGLVRSPDGVTDREALELIFEPGFSTSDAVSQLSGRGVGMDVVKSTVTSLSGTISVETEQGRGCRFVLSLPLTQAIVRILIIETGGESYGLPVAAIQETVDVSPEDILSQRGSEFLPVREETFPVVRLDRYFGRPAPPHADAAGYAVVVGSAGRRVGILADDIRSQQDLVLKPLGDLFAGVRGFSGAVDLSDDRTVLVLDLISLIDEVYRMGTGHDC